MKHFPIYTEQENLISGLTQRIKILQQCQTLILYKYHNFLLNPSHFSEADIFSLFSISSEQLKSSQSFYESLLSKNFLSSKYQVFKSDLYTKKYEISIKESSDPFEYFTQEMYKKVDRKADDLTGFVRSKAELSEDFGLIVEGHFLNITCFALSKNKNFLATGSEDCSIKIWEYCSLNIIASFVGHALPISSVVFMNNCNQIVSASLDSKILVWDFFGNIQHTVHGFEAIILIAISSTDHLIAFVTQDETIKIWNFLQNSSECVFDKYTSCIKSICFSQTGSYLIFGSSLFFVLIFHIPEGLIKQIRFHDLQVNCICISIDDQFIVSGSSDTKVIIFKTNSIKPEKVLIGHECDVLCVEISDDNRFILSGSCDSCIKMWNVNDGTCFKSLSLEFALQVRFGKNNELVTCEEKNVFRVWDENCVVKSNQHEKNVRCVKFCKGRRFVLCADEGGVVKVWDLQRKDCVGSRVARIEEVWRGLVNRKGFVWCQVGGKVGF